MTLVAQRKLWRVFDFGSVQLMRFEGLGIEIMLYSGHEAAYATIQNYYYIHGAMAMAMCPRLKNPRTGWRPISLTPHKRFIVVLTDIPEINEQ